MTASALFHIPRKLVSRHGLRKMETLRFVALEVVEHLQR